MQQKFVDTDFPTTIFGLIIVLPGMLLHNPPSFAGFVVVVGVGVGVVLAVEIIVVMVLVVVVVIIFFYSASLRLASTRWVQSTF